MKVFKRDISPEQKELDQLAREKKNLDLAEKELFKKAQQLKKIRAEQLNTLPPSDDLSAIEAMIQYEQAMEHSENPVRRGFGFSQILLALIYLAATIFFILWGLKIYRGA